jgi:hypothetical protein
VLRIRRETCPRPVLVQRTVGTGVEKTALFWMPVRIPGGTRQATRAEMAALFAEQSSPVASLASSWGFNAPQVPTGKDGLADPSVDMVILPGLRIAPGPAAPGRPLSERAISELCAALGKSPITDVLFNLTGLSSTGIYGFKREGRPNTSGTATLWWRIADGIVPFAVTVRIEAPDQYGHSHIQTVDVTIEIVSKLSAWMAAGRSPLLPSPGGVRWLDPSEWTALLDAIIATLTTQAITTSLADLADVDAFLVPPPRTIHVVSDKEIARFLTPYLRPVPGAQGSRGAHLRADPALSLADPAARVQQTKRWICQISADAGCQGMENLIEQV